MLQESLQEAERRHFDCAATAATASGNSKVFACILPNPVNTMSPALSFFFFENTKYWEKIVARVAKFSALKRYTKHIPPLILDSNFYPCNVMYSENSSL
jgi:hypothetical protein